MKQIHLIILTGIAISLLMALMLITLSFFWPLFDYAAHEGVERIKLHLIPCSVFPTTQQADAIVAGHNETVAEIEKIGGGWVSAEENTRCPRKALIGIYYGTEAGKEKIKQLIGEDFYGAPIRWQNV